MTDTDRTVTPFRIGWDRYRALNGEVYDISNIARNLDSCESLCRKYMSAEADTLRMLADAIRLRPSLMAAIMVLRSHPDASLHVESELGDMPDIYGHTDVHGDTHIFIG